jgi:hypothetical protein
LACFAAFDSIFSSKAAQWHAFQSKNKFWFPFYNFFENFQSQTYFVSQCCSCAPFPLESVLKVILIGIGLACEVITALDNNGRFVNIGNAQHITMFFFFGTTAVIEVLHHYRFHVIHVVFCIVNICLRLS